MKLPRSHRHRSSPGGRAFLLYSANAALLAARARRQHAPLEEELVERAEAPEELVEIEGGLVILLVDHKNLFFSFGKLILFLIRTEVHPTIVRFP